MDYAFGVHYTGISVMSAIGLLVLWLLLAGYSIRDLSARAILTIAGHLRTRPDPWLECALRTAFTEFDHELALILKDRGHPPRLTANQAGRSAPSASAPPEPSPGSAEPPPSGVR